MKHISYKKLVMLCSIICIGNTIVSCQDDETLNLVGYPENPISIKTDDEANVKVDATYNEEGKLILSSLLSKTWEVSLSTPSPEDASIKLSPILVNIPAEKVTLSTDVINFPAGSMSKEVTLEVDENDLSFMEDNLQAETYELGLAISEAKGMNLNTNSSLGKLVVEKEKYKATVSMIGSEESSTEFTKIFFNDNLFGDPITYSFKLSLDKPAKEDVVIKLSETGVPEDFINTSKFTPQTIKIAAGQKESENVEWTITDDFLTAVSGDKVFDITLKAEIEKAEYTEMSLQNETINLKINKTSNILTLSSGKPREWVEVPNKRRWKIELGDGWVGYTSDLTDGSRYSPVSVASDTDTTHELVVDLLANKTLVGLGMAFGLQYYPSWELFAPTESEWLVSTDKVNWTSLGVVNNTLSNRIDRHYFHLLLPIEARYVKYKGKINPNLNRIDLTEIYVYTSK